MSQSTLTLPTATATPPTTLSGVVERVTFSDPESQWTVARLTVQTREAVSAAHAHQPVA